MFGFHFSVPGRLAALYGLALLPSCPLLAMSISSGGQSVQPLRQLLLEDVLLPECGEPSDEFGASIAVSGDTIVVGAYGESSAGTGGGINPKNNALGGAGAAYVFRRSAGSWRQTAFLKASNPDSLDWFGRSVALFGDTLVVGADREDGGATEINGNQEDNSCWSCGALYVFVRHDGVWTQEAYLKGSQGTIYDFLGRNVAMHGDTIVAGVESKDGFGGAYVFARGSSGWEEQAFLPAPAGASGGRFGEAIAIWGDVVAIADSTRDAGAGRVFLYQRVGTNWSALATLSASNADPGDAFGTAISMSATALVVGAPNESSASAGLNGNGADNSLFEAGAVYLFEPGPGGWAEKSYIKDRNPRSSGSFGSYVALVSDRLAVGRRFNPTFGVTWFDREGTDWRQQVGQLQLLEGQLAADGERVLFSNVFSGDPSLQGVVKVFGARALQQGPGGAIACLPAQTTGRSAPGNPDSYVASRAVLGGRMTLRSDLGATGHSAAWFFAFESPASVTLSGGQVLLCLDQGQGELFTGAGIGPVLSASVATYDLSVPVDSSMCGRTIYSQAIHALGPAFLLTNAQDIRLGV